MAESSVVIITAIGNGKKQDGKESWSLYFSYPYSDITAEWIDNETVRIKNANIHHDDGFVVLNIFQNPFYTDETDSTIKRTISSFLPS